jgi:hypothetical protein
MPNYEKMLRVGALAAALVSGQEAGIAAAQEHKPQAVQAESLYNRPYIHYDSSAHSIMLKTGVMFRGAGLYLARVKKDIDLAQNGEVIGVEVLAQGQAGLLVKIHKKSAAAGGPDNMTEIKIYNGFLQGK